MIHHRVAQGSGEWLTLRAGMPTASQFHRIVTPAKWQLSKQARGYAFRLAAELLLNEVTESIEGVEWIERGKELEPKAVEAYEFGQEIETQPCGFLTTDDGRLGATPDRLIVGAPAALEIKCPAPWTHLEYMIDGFGADYVVQAQGQIFVGEFDFVDRYSFHPSMPAVPQRTYRNDEQQRILGQALRYFLDMRDEILECARRQGVFAEHRRLFTATDEFAAGLSGEQS
ncbi:MAG TPA: YqaJ viral recombinase family protein [Stellaceae bacterium]|nr:YqaJ viral recombinase family protein [Stellaceae bacterium]